MTEIKRRVVSGGELWWLREGPGAHGQEPKDVHVVADALAGSFRFVEESSSAHGLRKPQLGALHAVLAHRSTEEAEPITIVMPTGTGKTETMLAAYCYEPSRTMVVVPSDALRTQIAEKFVTLGVLAEVGAVIGGFLCPAVLVLSSGLTTVEEADELLDGTNVIVATAQALDKCSEPARTRLTGGCTRLFVDEAHHVGARTWREIVDLFSDREVVQFTATPYREDGRHLGGRVAYAYPLRLAQKHGYFARVNYRSIIDLSDPDRAVATAAVEQLRADLDAGYDHLLMARVSSVERAKQVVALYEELAPDLHPLRIDTGLAGSTRRKRQDRLGQDCRIVVCVNMLGEGFDLPNLKIAAVHDPQKSLAVTLQFIGRFTRTGSGTLGEASAFVPLQVTGVDERLRKLYGEDADWNEVIQDLTERGVGREKARSDFERGFGSLPREIAMRSIHPKMSTVVYQTPTAPRWRPEGVYDLFEDRLLTTQLGINNSGKVVWWVSRQPTPVRWGEFASFNELVHHLYVAHLDDSAGFLYINSTDNNSLHEDIARTVCGDSVTLLRGESVYRILAQVQRRIPTNVGLLDSVSRNRRFSMHVGQDVLHAWRGEGGTKMKTNIFAHGFTDGRAVSFGASRKGRVWSHERARDIHDWVRWAKRVGPVITDTSISLETVMSGFLLPKPATERPPLVPLSIEWPHHLVATMSENRKVLYSDAEFSLLDTELTLIAHTTDGPLQFALRTPEWSLQFAFEFDENEPPRIRPIGEDGVVTTPSGRGSLAAFLTAHGLLVTFENELVLVEQGYLLQPDRERRLFPTDSIEVFDWSGIEIKRESQGPDRDPSTVQHRAIDIFSTESDWELIVDDDGTGELADVVFLRRVDDELEVLLAHCKYSSEEKPGARIGDLYDVCGQAMKMNRAKSMPELLTKRLFRRENERVAAGRSGILTGDIETLAAVVREARFRRLRVTVAIIQPGMSKMKASEDMRALLGAADRFLSEKYDMTLRVVASP
ncbi:DEAD/DEAH box helicase [Pseudonocardia sp. EC080619-01]|uniref:DEAD/DEAH box helicase n=1 Tax=Pseudonocardia sp. EC080619-01 TaxID=1096856 RepID=UPI0009E78144|nr:DEAD/DEAH box helicase family protein [Pseudonocardia sp. EC080619-01]